MIAEGYEELHHHCFDLGGKFQDHQNNSPPSASELNPDPQKSFPEWEDYEGTPLISTLTNSQRSTHLSVRVFLTNSATQPEWKSQTATQRS